MEKQDTQKSRLSATICMGLALFATQFGAGNLIFPPFLGRNTGSDWFTGFIGFFIMDVGLAAAAVFSVVANRKGDIDGVVGKIGRIPGKIMVTVIILCLGPAVCIPRTAATTYEMGVHLLFPSLPLWLFGAIFFGIVLLFVMRPSKVVDIVGNYLTPILLATMTLLIVIGIVNPISESEIIANSVPLHDGILNGYQTLDGIGGVLMTLMLVTAATSYGFKKQSDINHMVAGADIISAVLLALVYGGLTFLGSTVSAVPEFAGLEQAPLLIAITNRLLGNFGVVALTVIVLMACLTTAIGLSSVAGNYFEELSGGKIKYKTTVVTIIVLSYAMSNVGLSTIISLAAPVLSVLYPPLIVLVVMAFLEKFIKNDRVAGFAAYGALAFSLIDAANFGGTLGTLMSALPFAEYGLGWITPAMVFGLIGSFFKVKNVHVEIEHLDMQN